MNKKVLTAIISAPLAVGFISPLVAKADPTLTESNRNAIFTSESCDEVTKEYLAQHIEKNLNATANKTDMVYPREASNIPGQKKLDPQFRRKSGVDAPTSKFYAINGDSGNRGWMTVRVYIPENQVAHLESEACVESKIECPIPGDDDVVVMIKGKSTAIATESGKFEVTYTYEKISRNGVKDMKLKVFADEKDPTRKYFIVSSRKAKLPFPDSPVDMAEITDRYNEHYRQAVSKLPASDPKKAYPGEVIYTACKETVTVPFTGTVTITRNEDIVATSLKYCHLGSERKTDTLMFVPASEVTADGSPATQNAAEECVAQRTGKYALGNSGSIDHYYINTAVCHEGCLYNPFKCAILKGVPIYCDDKARLLPGITSENVLTCPTVDILLHASRNLNPGVGGACPQMIHPNPVSNVEYTDVLKTWNSLIGKPDKSPKDQQTLEKLAPKISEISELAKDEIYASAKQVICLARAKGYKKIVFNNPGGGVFRNGITIWADALATAIKQYAGNMQIVFTIFDKNIAPNYAVLLPPEPADSTGKMNFNIYEDAMKRNGIVPKIL